MVFHSTKLIFLSVDIPFIPKCVAWMEESISHPSRELYDTCLLDFRGASGIAWDTVLIWDNPMSVLADTSYKVPSCRAILYSLYQLRWLYLPFNNSLMYVSLQFHLSPSTAYTVPFYSLPFWLSNDPSLSGKMTSALQNVPHVMFMQQGVYPARNSQTMQTT